MSEHLAVIQAGPKIVLLYSFTKASVVESMGKIGVPVDAHRAVQWNCAQNVVK